MIRFQPDTRLLAVAISLALLPTQPVLAAESAQRCGQQDEHCIEERGSRGWLWGGLAALGVGAAVSGGGSSSKGADVAPGGGGSPGVEGGTHGDGGILVGAGAEAHWSQPVTTRVTGYTRNEGQLQLSNGALHIAGDGELRNVGSISLERTATLRIDGDADFDNHGRVLLRGALTMDHEGSFENHGHSQFEGATVLLTHEAEIDNHGSMSIDSGTWSLSGSSDLDNNHNAVLDVINAGFKLSGRSGVENAGTINARGTMTDGALFDVQTSQYGYDRDAITVLDNRGSIILQGDGGVLRVLADSFASHALNRIGGQIQSNAAHSSLLRADGAQATLLNQGTLTVTGDGAVAMHGTRGAIVINDGVINLGTPSDHTGRGLVAMKSDGSATLNNRRGGVINIHTGDSFAFQMGAGAGRLINHGVVNVYASGSGAYADATTASAAASGQGLPDLGRQAPRGVSGYTVGTHADGTAGRLALQGGGMLQDVEVDTGFTRGTDASQVTLYNVITGVDGGAENVRSTTVAWTAHAVRNGEGGIDVTLRRNDYRTLAGVDQAGVASALEQGYRNDALFHSLEVADGSQFQQALQQLSGAGVAASALHTASNGDAVWSQLAALPADRAGLLAFGGGRLNAFGVRGEGSAAQVALTLGNGHSLQMMAGALSGGLDSAQQRGHSNFAGVGLARHWGDLQLRYQLGYERHEVESQRTLAWGQTHEVASSLRRMQRSLLAATLSHNVRHGDLHWEPRLKGTAFQLDENAFNETGANGFGLQVAEGRTRGMRVELGSQVSYPVASNLWLRADVAVVRAMAVRSGTRQAQLLGAPGHAFALAGLRAGALDHQVSWSMDYQRERMTLAAQAVAQRLWGQNDTRAEVQLAYRFR